MSGEAIALVNSKKVANHSRFDSPNSAISSQLSAPQMVAQTAITNISFKECSFFLSIRGSFISPTVSNNAFAFNCFNFSLSSHKE